MLTYFFFFFFLKNVNNSLTSLRREGSLRTETRFSTLLNIACLKIKIINQFEKRENTKIIRTATKHRSRRRSQIDRALARIRPTARTDRPCPLPPHPYFRFFVIYYCLYVIFNVLQNDLWCYPISTKSKWSWRVNRKARETISRNVDTSASAHSSFRTSIDLKLNKR